MALVHCPDCGQEVSGSAPACPKCGKPMKKARAKWTAKHWIVLAILVLGVAAYMQGRHPGAGAKSGEKASASDQAKRDEMLKARLKGRYERQLNEGGGDDIVTVSASQLYADYKANEVAADAKYKGKWIRVTGQVDSVSKDISGDPFVSLATDGYGLNVNAMLFDVQIKDIISDTEYTICSGLDKAALIKKGQRLTIEGQGAGSVLGMPGIKMALVMAAGKK